MRRLGGIATAVVLLGLGQNAALATPSQSSAPGSFVATCAGEGTGSFVQGGESISYGQVRAGTSACTSSSAVSPTAALATSITDPAQASYGGTFSAGAAASVSTKQIHLDATMSGTASSLFPTGVAQGGFTDQLLFTSQPAGTVGEMDFLVHVDGTLSASGNVARPGFWVTPYVNGQSYSGGAVYNAANPHPVVGSLESVGYETRIWFNGIDNFPNPQADLIVDQDVLFTAPFVFGTPFSLGLYAVADASTGAFGNSNVLSTATVDFQNTITLEGIQAVTVGGNSVAYTLTSTSGIDYALQTAVPEPASFGLLGLGLAACIVRRNAGKGAG